MAVLRVRYWALMDEWATQIFSLLPADWARVDAIEAELEQVKQEMEAQK